MFTLPANLVLKLTDHGINFTVVFVPPSPETRDQWKVRVYDGRYDFTEYGQFISSYYLSTFLGGVLGGINLEGSVPEWYLSIDAVRKIHHHIIFNSDIEFYKELVTRPDGIQAPEGII
jgi:hypothetical protein